MMNYREVQRMTYLSVAMAAADLERKYQYEDAAEMWLDAYLLARSRQEKHWCEHRAEFCVRQINF